MLTDSFTLLPEFQIRASEYAKREHCDAARRRNGLPGGFSNTCCGPYRNPNITVRQHVISCKIFDRAGMGRTTQAEVLMNVGIGSVKKPTRFICYFRSSAIVANCSNAASKSFVMSCAMISGAGRLADSSSASSFSQKMSRFILSRFTSSS